MSGHWRIERGLIKPSDQKVAAEFGTAFHLSLEAYYKSNMSAEGKEKALIAFPSYFSKFETPSDDKRTTFKGISLLSKYWEKYPTEPFDVIETEIGGAFILSNEWTYCTRIDLVAQWKSPKGIYVIDHKTTSDLMRLIGKPSNQFTGYIYNAAEMYEGVLGLLVNGIGVYKGENKRNKGTGKMEERDPFTRIPTSRSRVELDEWKERVLIEIRTIESYQKEKVWPQHSPDYCTAFRGRCAYVDLCNAGSEEVQERLIESAYKVEWWKPWRENENKEEGGEE